MPVPTRSTTQTAPVLPSPIARAEAISPGDVAHRNLYCALYGGCLEVAARKGWRDWSCEKCSVRLEVKTTGAAQWANARIRID